MTNEAQDMSEDIENDITEDETADQHAAPDGPVDEAALQAEEDADAEGAAGDPADDDPDVLYDGTDRLSELEEQVADLNDKLLRAVAETENVRRRSQREKEDASKYAIAGFAGDMVSVADNLSRALESIDTETRANDEAVNNLMTGVEMTLRDLLNTFERTGIKRVEALDKPFDHNLHEAMFEVEDLEKPTGAVFQIIQDGFTSRDRVLRPAKVGVTKGGPKAPPAAETSTQDQTPDQAPEQTKAYEQGAEGPGGNLDEEL